MKSKSQSKSLLCVVNDSKEPGHPIDVPIFHWRNIILLKMKKNFAMLLAFCWRTERVPFKMFAYSIRHTLKCKIRDFVTVRHNKERDFDKQFLKEASNDVKIKPAVQSIEEEIVEGFTGDKANFEARARRFWRDGQLTF